MLAIAVAVLCAYLAPVAVHASQTRADDDVTIGADEMIDESLIIGAETVRIDGRVDGDVLVTAQRVVITGVVRGNIDALAEEVAIEGDVDGTVHCLCRRIVVRGHVHENLNAIGETIVVGSSGRVSRDVLAFGQNARIEGDVARDLRFHGETLELIGTIGRDVTGDVAALDASSGAVVDGDIDVQIPHPDMVTIDPAATVGGQTRIEMVEDVRESEYTQVGFYLWQLAQLAGAFVVGFVLLRVYPPLLTADLGGARRLAASAGIGLILLIVVPVASVIAILTLVGIPLGLIGLGVYLVALYLSAIVVGARLGRVVLASRADNIVLALFVGLLILTIATELPYVGGFIALVVVVLGLGLLYRVFTAQSPRPKAPRT